MNMSVCVDILWHADFSEYTLNNILFDMVKDLFPPLLADKTPAL